MPTTGGFSGNGTYGSWKTLADGPRAPSVCATNAASIPHRSELAAYFGSNHGAVWSYAVKRTRPTATAIDVTTNARPALTRRSNRFVSQMPTAANAKKAM